VAESYHFKEINREPSESIASYSTRILRGAATCHFGEYLDRALRDLFIAGLRHKFTKKKLLDKNRIFYEYMKIARAEEAAEREVDLVHGEPDHAVHSVQPAARRKFFQHNKCYSSYSHSSKPSRSTHVFMWQGWPYKR